jgi:hypothetical protein
MSTGGFPVLAASSMDGDDAGAFVGFNSAFAGITPVKNACEVD